MTDVDGVRERVLRLLTDQHGAPGLAPDGSFVVDVDATRVHVRVEPDHDHTLVVVTVVVRDDVEGNDALLRLCATHDAPLGNLRFVETADGHGTVLARHALLGDTLDPDELRYAVETVVATARSVHTGPDDAPPPTNPRFSGSITVPLPPGWFAKESFTVLAPDGQANVIASSEPLDPSIDMERYAEVQRGLLEKEFPEYHEIGTGELTLAGGITARWREFGWKPPDGVRVRQVQLYAVPVPGRGYTATATSADAGWDRYAETLRRILFDVAVRPRYPSA